jgi:DNA anti-recombination protein RmuC
MIAKNKSPEESVFKGNEVMIMLEQMSDGIAIIAENQQGLTKRFDKFEGRFDKFEGRFDKFEGRFDKFERETNEKFEQVFEYLSRIEDEIVALRKDLEILKETKADKKDLLGFDKRLKILETQMAKLQRQTT